MDPAMSSLLQTLLFQVAGGMGGNGMYMGGGAMSPYDQQQAMIRNQERLALMQGGAAADRATQMSQAQNLAAAAGVTWTSEVDQAANWGLDAIGAVTPYFAADPRMAAGLEALGGKRGSYQVMRSNIYAPLSSGLDPATGQVGYTAASQQYFAGQIEQQLYNDNVVGQRQLRAGDMGSVYAEMSRRGLMGSSGARTSAADFSSPSEVRALHEAAREQGVAGLSTQQMAEDPSIRGAASRRIDAKQAISTLKDYEGTFAAMREIFGSSGMTNTPMGQLVASLEQLSGGSMQQFSRTRLETMTRNLGNMAQQANIGVQELEQISRESLGMTKGLGISAAFTHDLDIQRAAFQASGYDVAGGGWGADTLGQLAAKSSHLQGSAVASSMGQMLGVYSRLEETRGGVREGSQAAAWKSAVAAGRSTYTYQGQDFSVRQSPQALSSMMGRGFGTRSATVLDMFGDQGLNEEILSENPELQTQLYGLQRSEFLDAGAREAARSLQGYGDKRSRGQVITASRNAMDELLKQDSSVLHDRKKRNQVIASSLRSQLPHLPESQLLTLADSLYGNYDTVARGSMYGSVANVHHLYSDDRMRSISQRRGNMELDTEVEKVMAPYKDPETFLGRFSEALREDDADLGPVALLRRTLGIQSGAPLEKSLAAAGSAFDAELAQIENLRTRASTATGPEREDLMRQIGDQQGRLDAAAKRLRMEHRAGGYSQAPVGAGDTGEEAGAGTGRGMTLGELKDGFRSGFDKWKDLRDRDGPPPTVGGDGPGAGDVAAADQPIKIESATITIVEGYADGDGAGGGSDTLESIA